MFLKICAIAVVSSIAYAVLKGLGVSLTFAIKLASAVLAGGALVTMLSPLISEILSFSELGRGMGKYVDTVMRTLGLAMIAHVSADVCRDCGEASLAGGVELAFKCETILLCLPIIRDLVGYAREIMSL